MNWQESLALSRVPEHHVLAQAVLEQPPPAPAAEQGWAVLWQPGLGEGVTAPWGSGKSLRALEACAGAVPPLPPQAGNTIKGGLSQIWCPDTCS